MKFNAWLLCRIMVVILSIFAFSPLTLSQNNPYPYLFGLPRTLWIGIIISLAFIFVTIIGALCDDNKAKGEKQ